MSRKEVRTGLSILRLIGMPLKARWIFMQQSSQSGGTLVTFLDYVRIWLSYWNIRQFFTRRHLISNIIHLFDKKKRHNNVFMKEPRSNPARVDFIFHAFCTLDELLISWLKSTVRLEGESKSCNVPTGFIYANNMITRGFLLGTVG